jgi:cytochrome bd ubiquinol oxidase subunit II
MLLALVFRGVAFEFRWRTRRGKFVWDWAFAAGSVAATFTQGIALGTIVQGIPVADRAYAGGWWNWLTAFSVFTGIALIVGYALLGAGWLILKTDGALQEKSRRFALVLAPATLVLIGLVSLWTPFLEPLYMERWFTWPRMLYTVPVPVLVAASAYVLIRGIVKREELTPFLASLALFVLSYIGIGISFYPYIVPPTLTIWDAAAPDESLGFLLIGAVVLIPIILAYTAYAYWVFRGKVGTEGYH